jgi:Ca-activated chloride channel homolog
MEFQFGNPYFLLLMPVALAFVAWLAWKSDVQLSESRRWLAFAMRSAIVIALVLALAELQWKRSEEGMNTMFLLDRSQSIPSAMQEEAREYVIKSAQRKEPMDKGGLIVFGEEAGIESLASKVVNIPKIDAVVGTERTDIAQAIQLGTVAFPEAGQKRLVLLSDGNENVGDALGAVTTARAMDITTDVVPMEARRGNDVAVQKFTIPPNLKKGQVFDAKVFIYADRAGPAVLRFYRDEQFLGEQKVELSAGRNLFTLPQTLSEPGFYSYDVRIEAEGDTVPQNNHANAFTSVAGNPRILVVSTDVEADKSLVNALQRPGLEIKHITVNQFPGTLAELQSYDSIFLSNVAAGDLGTDMLKLLESAVRDFGVGLVCVGGDQTYTAGAYRGTPLETMLPLEMELDSKKVLPAGALVLIIDKSGSMSGRKIEMVKQAAMGAVDALGAKDYVAVLAFDGATYTVSDFHKATDKKEILKSISGITADGGTDMYPPMAKAYEMLKDAPASLKHCIVLTDGESQGGDFGGIARSMAEKRITVSTVGVGRDVNGPLLRDIANIGKGTFYEVDSPDLLPQIFIKETATILKSAIYEDPFKPQFRASSEMLSGIGAAEYPSLLGYVGTTPKPRAEVPLWTDKEDPLLAHWQYGLGRTVAFTSDARAKWARNWLSWSKYQQFWTQVAQWSLRRVENTDFKAEIALDKGKGELSVDALNERGDYQNFLDLKAVVISPRGERNTMPLAQTGAGHYEAAFPTKETGLYMVNLMEQKNGKTLGSQTLGASINYSPEFGSSEPNMNLLQKLADIGGGRILNLQDPDNNAFLHDRQKTFMPVELWQLLMKFAVLLFTLDVGIRRVQLDPEELQRFLNKLPLWLFFWIERREVPKSEDSLSALLSRREQVRSTTAASSPASQKPVFQAWQKQSVPSAVGTAQSSAPTPQTSAESETNEAETNTTSRLLNAKRRAWKRNEEGE